MKRRPPECRSMRHVMFDALCQHPYGLTAQQLISVCYPDPDREPDEALANVRVAITRSNHWYKRFNSPFRIYRVTLSRYSLFLRRVRK